METDEVMPGLHAWWHPQLRLMLPTARATPKRLANSSAKSLMRSLPPFGCRTVPWPLPVQNAARNMTPRCSSSAIAFAAAAERKSNIPQRTCEAATSLRRESIRPLSGSPRTIQNIRCRRLRGPLNLVTAAAWPGHPEWIRRFLEVLGTKIGP